MELSLTASPHLGRLWKRLFWLNTMHRARHIFYAPRIMRTSSGRIIFPRPDFQAGWHCPRFFIRKISIFLCQRVMRTPQALKYSLGRVFFAPRGHDAVPPSALQFPSVGIPLPLGCMRIPSGIQFPLGRGFKPVDTATLNFFPHRISISVAVSTFILLQTITCYKYVTWRCNALVTCYKHVIWPYDV